MNKSLRSNSDSERSGAVKSNDSSPGRAGGFGNCEPLKATVTEPLRGSLNPLKGDRVYSNPS
jgi:hypothetical protein